MGQTKVTNVSSPTVKVFIEQHHIDQSCRRDSTRCMISEAVVDSFNRRKRGPKECINVTTDLRKIRLSVPALGLRFEYDTPPRAYRALLAFDRGDHMEPFSFTLTGAVRAYKMGWHPTENTRRRHQERQKTQRKKYPRRKRTTDNPVLPRHSRRYGLCQLTE